PCNTVFRISVAHASLLRRQLTCRIDDTADTVHGHQQLSLFNAHYDERCFPPLPVYDAGTGHCVLTIPRPGKTPDGKEVRAHPRCDRGARRRCSQSLRGGAEREGSANPSATDHRRVCRLRLRGTATANGEGGAIRGSARLAIGVRRSTWCPTASVREALPGVSPRSSF